MNMVTNLILMMTMKYKKRKLNLEARIKAWETRGGQNKESGHLHTKPGSLNK